SATSSSGGGCGVGTTRAPTRFFTGAQVESYQRDGYLAVRGVLAATQIGTLRRVTEALVERSRAVTKSDALFDLDPRHTAAQPVLRRIKNPADNDPLYRWVT